MEKKIKNKLNKIIGQQIKIVLESKKELIGAIVGVDGDDIVFIERLTKKTDKINVKDIKHLEEYHYQPKEILLVPNEVDFKVLKSGDKFQLLTRYLNDICTYLKNVATFEAETSLLLKFLCEKQGINIEEEKRKITEKTLEELKLKEEQLKENLENKKVVA